MFVFFVLTVPVYADDFSALGRGPSAGRIIYGISDTAYVTKDGNAITEEMISGLSTGDYGRTGLIADGNSRLILRYRAAQPGTVAFSVSPSVSGSRLESFTSRQEITAPLSTTATTKGYQVSAVLVAPETWPSSIAYPSGNFTVTAEFTPSDGGNSTTETITLTLKAPSVVLIHGAFGDNERMFGYLTGTNKGVWHKLENAGLNVASWNYDNTKAPKALISSNTNGLANIIADTLNTLNGQGFEATRVDLVTHSSGGLAARQYLRNDIDTGNKTANSYGQGTVRRVVTIASPNLGTPIASYLAENFSSLPESWQNWQAKSWWEVGGYTLLSLFVLNGKDTDEAMNDLSLNSSYLAGLGYPGVPFHSIYGKVKADDAKISQLFDDVVNQNIVSLSEIDWLPKQLVDNLTSSKLALISGILKTVSDDIRFKELLYALHGDDDHDLVVSEPSAKDIFPSNAVTAFEGLGKYNHVVIGQQDDVGERVIALLKGGLENFMINTASTAAYNVAFDAASESFFAEYLKASDEYDDLSEYIDGSIDFDASTPIDEYLGAEGDDEDEEHILQSVKISGTTNTSFSDDIYFILSNGDDIAKFFVLNPSDSNSFNIDMWADREDKGVYEVSYFTVQNGKLKISPTKQIVYIPPVNPDSLPVLGNANGGKIYAYAGDEVPAGFVIKSGNGNYDISSPIMDIVSYSVSDPSIAEITSAGKIRALKEGTTVIKATAYGQTAEINFIVKQSASEEDLTKDLVTSVETFVPAKSSGGGCNTGFGIMILLSGFALFGKKH